MGSRLLEVVFGLKEGADFAAGVPLLLPCVLLICSSPSFLPLQLEKTRNQGLQVCMWASLVTRLGSFWICQ